MKSLNQIVRYTIDCNFPDKDWAAVLTYCQERYGGGKIHRRLSAKHTSTYPQFLDWVENGFGAGDIVGYGNTMGMVKTSAPDFVMFAAYCDYEGNLIVKDMKVLEPDRIQALDEERKRQFKEMLYKEGKEFHIRLGEIGELYMPNKNSYIIGVEEGSGNPFVGIFSESEGDKCHCVASLIGNTFHTDNWINIDYTPLRAASKSDIKRLHQAANDAGWSFNKRLCRFVQFPQKKKDNVYYYLNERFELIMDWDDGTKIHQARYDAGNYILDLEEGLMFMNNVKKLRGKA